jgi:hypothetical protein
MSGRKREKDLELTGEFGIEQGNCNFPLVACSFKPFSYTWVLDASASEVTSSS